MCQSLALLIRLLDEQGLGSASPAALRSVSSLAAGRSSHRGAFQPSIHPAVRMTSAHRESIQAGHLHQAALTQRTQGPSQPSDPATDRLWHGRWCLGEGRVQAAGVPFSGQVAPVRLSAASHGCGRVPRLSYELQEALRAEVVAAPYAVGGRRYELGFGGFLRRVVHRPQRDEQDTFRVLFWISPVSVEFVL
jgi:hypothetical protein